MSQQGSGESMCWRDGVRRDWAGDRAGKTSRAWLCRPGQGLWTLSVVQKEAIEGLSRESDVI